MIDGGIYSFLHSDQSLWIVCAGLYLLDQFRLHPGRQMILVETLSLGWIPLIPVPHYRLRGYPVSFLNPCLPFLAAVRMDWLAKLPFSPTRFDRTRHLLTMRQRGMLPFRLLGTVNFMTLFLLGPTLTNIGGLEKAFSILIPYHVLAILVLIYCLFSYRRIIRIELGQILLLTLECAVCPGYFVNICRKVSLAGSKIRGDAVAYLLCNGQSKAIEDLEGHLDNLIRELEFNGQIHERDRPTLAAYGHYLSSTSTKN